jgi:tryptophan synthase beta chain
VGPQHAWLKDQGRAQYVAIDDGEALDAFAWLARHEGILPALESAHAVAYVRKLRGTLAKDAVVVVNLSGRGDKDLEHAARALRERGDR